MHIVLYALVTWATKIVEQSLARFERKVLQYLGPKRNYEKIERRNNKYELFRHSSKNQNDVVEQYTCGGVGSWT